MRNVKDCILFLGNKQIPEVCSRPANPEAVVQLCHLSEPNHSHEGKLVLQFVSAVLMMNGCFRGRDQAVR